MTFFRYPTILEADKSTKRFTPEQEACLQRCIDIVGIGFLSDREKDEASGLSGFYTVKKWEDSLSLGEQQRLSMARLFYNRPVFGVLDECTSAVSQDVERGLYQSAYDEGITAITISQRMALEEFHSQELHLGANDESGFSLRKISA